MQRIRAFGRRQIVYLIVIPCIVLIALVVIDQLTKYAFQSLYETNGNTTVIKNFFYFTCVYNKGSAFSFLSEKSWGQLFFKILTPVALIAFIVFLIFAVKSENKWCIYSLILIISGTIGNYIDRLLYGKVTDFIGLQFGSYYFPVFNFADICLTIGIIILIIYFLFIDKNAVFSKKKNTEDEADKNERT